MIGRIGLVAAIASEGLAVYTVAEWFAAGYADGSHEATPAIALVAIALLAFFLPRAVEWLDLRPRPAAALMAAVAYVAIYGVVRFQFAGDLAIWDLGWVADFIRDPGGTMEGRGHVLIGALLIVALWARSAYRSGADVEIEALARTVTVPFIVVTAVLVLAVYTERAGIVARAGASYYVVAMLSLALGQLALSGASFGELRAGGTVATLLLGTIGAAVGCAVVFWLVFGIVGPVVGPWLETAIFVSLTVILTPIAWAMDQIMTFLLGDLGGADGLQFPDANFLQETAERDPGDEPNAAQRGGIYATRVLILLVAMGGLALILAWFTRLRRRAARQQPDGEVAGLGGALKEDMRGMLASLLRRPRRDSGIHATTAARRLYVEVLQSAAGRGLERAPDETPAELAPRLAGAVQNRVTDEITAAFLQSRYAGREPDPALVADLERRWRVSGA